MQQISSPAAFGLTVGMGLLLFACTWWLMGFSGDAAAWGQSVSFFALAYFCAGRYRDRLSLTSMGLALVLGRLLLELPVHIMDFRSSFGSLIVTLICWVAIGLGLLCYKEKRPAVFALSIVLVLVLNTFVLRLWDDICNPHSLFWH